MNIILWTAAVILGLSVVYLICSTNKSLVLAHKPENRGLAKQWWQQNQAFVLAELAKIPGRIEAHKQTILAKHRKDEQDVGYKCAEPDVPVIDIRFVRILYALTLAGNTGMCLEDIIGLWGTIVTRIDQELFCRSWYIYLPRLHPGRPPRPGLIHSFDGQYAVDRSELDDLGKIYIAGPSCLSYLISIGAITE